MSEKLPPHSIEAEAGVLGCILMTPECLDDAVAVLKAGAKVFYDLRHRAIYTALIEMQSAGEPIDMLTVAQRLRDSGKLESVGGLGYLSSLPDVVPSSAHLPAYTAIVSEKYALRRLVRTCAKAIEKAHANDGDPGPLLAQIQAGFNELETEHAQTLDGKECAVRMTDELERRFQLHQQGKRSGLVTGLSFFDHLTDGLQFGEQTIIAARPSIGKTAIGLNIVERVCINDEVPTLIVTLEMSAAALMRRLLSSHANIPMGDLRAGAFTEGQFQQFISFGAKLRNRPLWVVDGVRGMACDQVASSVRRVWRKHGVKLVLIDYLQKIRATVKQEKRTYEVAEVSGTLKALAVETGVAMLTLAQLNREPEKDGQNGRPPRLADLADSGQIERDADCVALLHRERKGENAAKASLIVAKQRDGELGTVILNFNGAYCRFENPNEQPGT